MGNSTQEGLLAFAKKLSKVLGPEESGRMWRITKDIDSEDVFFSLDSGMRIRLCNGSDRWRGIGEGRLQVRGIGYPPDPNRPSTTLGDYNKCFITVAEDRPIEVIAREIKRRFLPDYRAYFQQMLERQRHLLDERSRFLAAGEKITSALRNKRIKAEVNARGVQFYRDGEHHPESGQIKLINDWSRLPGDYNGEIAVELSLSRLTVDQTVSILAQL